MDVDGNGPGDPDRATTGAAQTEDSAEWESRSNAARPAPAIDNPSTPETGDSVEPASEGITEPVAAGTTEPASDSTTEPVAGAPAAPRADGPAVPGSGSRGDSGRRGRGEPGSGSRGDSGSGSRAEPDADGAVEPATGGRAEPENQGTAEPGAGATGGTPDALTAEHRAVLALERRGWSSSGAKERAIRERLGLAPVRYYQILNALLDDPRALAHDPVTVNRLRRIRETRRAER